MTIRMGQIGIGAWGSNVLRASNAAKRAQVLRACDASQAKVEAMATVYPNIDFTTDHNSLLTDPDLDAIIIATPAETHFELGKSALENGKHVFIEKPFVLNAKDGETLVALAEEKGLQLMVGHLLLYHPAYQDLKARVQSEDFGDLQYITSDRANLGTVRTHENVMWSFAPHDIAVVLYLMEEAPAQIKCTGSGFINSKIEDVCFLDLTFPSGRLAKIHVSWIYPRKIRHMSVVGTKQMIELDDTQLTDKIVIHNVGAEKKVADTGFTSRYEYESVTFRRGDTVFPQVPSGEPLRAEMQHFVDCIADNVEPQSSGRRSLDVIRILEKAEADLQAHRSAAS
ncbi:MAG: Gfo/Idh/MocA family protein [Magnetovibrionaceae bacterium]